MGTCQNWASGADFRFDLGTCQQVVDFEGIEVLSGALRLYPNEEAGRVGAPRALHRGGLALSLPPSCGEEKVWTYLGPLQPLLHHCSITLTLLLCAWHIADKCVLSGSVNE